ncbi:MAG: type II toxin-antitoxin system VapC family toxin [Salinibacter sp.]
MTVLVDANVFMDVLQARAGLRPSLQVLAIVRVQDPHTGRICALTVPILHYLQSRDHPEGVARTQVASIIRGCEIVDLTAEMIEAAFADTRMSDFEDGLQYQAARSAECDAIVTRNTADFPSVDMDVLTPEAFVDRARPPSG